MGSENEQKLTMHGLRHATGFVQSKLAKRLQTRFTPLVQFVVDEGVKKSLEMTRLIHEALGSPSEKADSNAEESASEEPSEGSTAERPGGG